MLIYFKRIGITLSMLLCVICGGPLYQSFSARNYLWKKAGYPNICALIDVLSLSFGLICNKFRRPENRINYREHCMECWSYWYVRHAKYKNDHHS